ncbi:MAG TPA: glutamate racemase [Acidimicrobiia bacterium]|jgi:glutamate racemase|nr:glutamate racemase [Acidimicrobiia bacterium]
MLDSGVGGLSVLLALRRLRPDLDVLYLADTAHAPYGDRSLAEVAEITHRNVGYLLAEGASVVALACNTASAAALHDLRRSHPSIPFVGMEPAVKPARGLTRSGVIGVLATEATFQGELFASVVGRFGEGLEVATRACPGWSDLVETGSIEGTKAPRLVSRHLDPVLRRGADTLVLGCTHYSFLVPTIARLAGAQTVIVDPAPAVARQIARTARHRGSGVLRFVSSGDTSSLEAVARGLTGWSLSVSAMT